MNTYDIDITDRCTKYFLSIYLAPFPLKIKLHNLAAHLMIIKVDIIITIERAMNESPYFVRK